MTVEPSTWVAVAQWVVSPLFGGFAALLTKNIGDRDKIRAHIDWVWVRDEGSFHPDAAAQIAIHNLSDRDVYVSGVNPRMGFLFIKFGEYTALSWGEDYDDGPQFPYKIAKGEVQKLFLNSKYLGKLVQQSGSFAGRFGKIFCRPRIKLEVTLTSGRRLRISAEDALENNARAAWYELPWWRLQVQLPPEPCPLDQNDVGKADITTEITGR